jgi:transcriptional regulator GlxA family with amidase domain
MRQCACEGISVDDVCKRLSISRRQFERRCMAALGHLPGEEIRRLRMARARDLLENTNLSLTQIALRCGYAHLSSFSAAFHQSTGQAPSELRRAAQP